MKYLKLLFIISFLYALTTMIVSRELIIPKMLTSINGHIDGDPQIYHAIALRKAHEIKKFGINYFELRPEGQGPAGIASLHYLISESPYGIVLLHALFHALSISILFLILRFWFSEKESIVGVLPLMLAPYMIFWFSQINKDSLTLLGTLIFLYGLLKLVLVKEKLRKKFISILVCSLGIFLIGIMRPYINQMLMPITILFLLAVSFGRKFSKIEFTNFFVASIVLLSTMFFCSSGAKSDHTLRAFEDFSNNYDIAIKPNDLVTRCFSSIKKNNWKDSSLVPNYINEKLRALMGQRCYTFMLLEKNYNQTTSDSILDSDVIPDGTLEAMKYLPRAFVIGLLSPFPNIWLYAIKTRASAFYSIVPIETIFLYVGLICIFFWIIKNKNFTILIPITFSIIMMTIMTMANPSIAVLYRYRFPWWMMIICIGFSAVSSLYNNRQVQKE